MTTINIELDPATGSGTIAIDGGEPTPFKSAEEVSSMIEQIAGQPDGDEAAAFNEAVGGQQLAAPQPQAKPQMGARGMGGM